MKRLFTLLLVALLSLSGGMPWAFAQYIYIYEREANRTHITDPANLAAGDVVLLQAADNASKFFRGAAQVGSIEQNSYWQLVAGDGGKFKLANYLSLQAGGTPLYVKATTTASLQPIQTTTDASQAAQFTLVNQGTGLTTNQGFIRFKTVYNGNNETFLNNATSEPAGVKFATGTGGWSYWKVFKADVFAKSQSISFDENAVSTHNSRYTNKVGLGDQAITWTSQAGDVIYRDLTSESMTVLVGSNLTPVIGYRGWAMYGYLYIDYNNDGDFTDEGELVSQLAGNTWASNSTADKTIPAFTITSTPGTYRARFKVEWNNTNPGGSYPSIAENGGSITDVTVHVVKDLSPSETILKNNIYALQELYGVIDATKISSNHPQTNEGSIAALIDNTYGTDNNRSYFHSNWNSGSETAGAHDLIYELTDATDAIHFYIQQRANGTGRPENITISGSNDGSTYTPISTINMTWGGDPLDTYSSKVTASTSYKYWKFEVNSTNSTNSSNAAGSRWFCASEWYVLPSNNTTDAFFDAATQLRAAATSVDDNVRTAAITNVATAKQTLDDDIAAHTKYTITYQVVDVNSNLLAQSTAEVYGGTIIDALPSNMRRDLFYTYSSVNATINSDQTLEFTATIKADAIFQFTANNTNPIWYSLTMSATPNYVTYSASSAQNVTLPTSNAYDATTHWAFIGNPYDGFTIINRAAGTSLVLGSGVTTGSSNNGGNVYATLAAAGTQTNEVWTVVSSSNRTNGFYLQNSEGHRLNKRNGTSNVSYWTGGSDAGSTFVATKVSLTDLIVTANALKTTLTDGANTVAIGYPTAAALATFADAIDAAQGVVGNGGDLIAGYDALSAAMKAVKSVANTNYTPRTDVYYTITSGRGSMIYDASHSGQTDATYGNEFLWYTTSLDAANVNHQWGFIEKDGSYYMYNVGKKQFANVTQGGSYQVSNGDKHTWMFSDAPSSVVLDGGEGGWVATPNVRVRATSEVTGNQYAMSISTSYVGPVIAYDAVNDGGIPMTFAVATTTQDATVTAAIEALLEDLTPYQEELQRSITALQNTMANKPVYTQGGGLNQYTLSTGLNEFLSSNTNAISDAQDLLNNVEDQTKANLSTKIAQLQTLNSSFLTDYKAYFTLNMPQAGSFLRIKTAPAHAATNATAFNNTQPYLIGTNHTTEITRAAFSTDASASSAANSIWYLAEISGTKYLVAYSNGYPTVNNNDFLGVGTGTQYLSTNGTSIVFEEAANKEIGTYNVKFGTNRYLFTNSGLYTDGGSGANGSNANGYNFELEAVTSLPVTVTAAGYSSLYLPVSVEIPEGVIAYIATVDQDVLRFTKVIDIIPAATPVVIEAEAGTYNFVVSAEDGSISGTNALQGSVANEACDAGVHYTLQKPTNMGIGFYRYSGTKLTGFKAYLPGSAVSGSGIRGFAFEDAFIDITTGIERFDNIQSDEIYDLQGRRVTTPAKGLYIIGGKKVYIK